MAKSNIIKFRDLAEYEWQAKTKTLAIQQYLHDKNLLMNAFAIECTDATINFGFPEETFLKSTLIESGVAGYDKATKKWSYVFGEDINYLGNPTKLQFCYRNGKTYRKLASYDKDKNGAYIVKALPEIMSIGKSMRFIAWVMANCDDSAFQNIRACRTPKIIACANNEIKLSVQQSVNKAENGEPVLFVSDTLGDALKGVSTEVEFIADKLNAYRTAKHDALLNQLGIVTSNESKKERIQSAEVNAGIGECKDYISLFIDTFNKQCESYDLPFKMRINNALEELYPVADATESIESIQTETLEGNINDK